MADTEKKVRKRKPKKDRRKNPHHKSAFVDGLNQKYLTYEQAVAYIATVPYITTKEEYKTWCRVKKFTFIPTTPEVVYRKQWTGWPDYLSTDHPNMLRVKDYLPYYEAIGIVHKLAVKYEVKTRDDWLAFYDDQYLIHEEDRELPIDRLPRHPTHKYDECKTFAQWLGTDIKDKVEEIKHRQKMAEDYRQDVYNKYEGQPVFAITTGVDPFKPNLVKIISDVAGLASLVNSVDLLSYTIHGVFILDQTQINDLTQTLVANGIDYGNSCYLVRNINSLIHDMRNLTDEIPQDKYR